VNRFAKIFRGQADWSQKKRRAQMRKCTVNLRQGKSNAVRRYHDCRQLRHTQDAAHSSLVAPTPAFPSALHTDVLVLDQPGRALVRATHGKQIRRGSHRSTRALEDAIRFYLADHNVDPKPFVWVKAADEIIDSIARFALRTSGTGH